MESCSDELEYDICNEDVPEANDTPEIQVPNVMVQKVQTPEVQAPEVLDLGVECKFSLVDNGLFLFGPGSKALFELIGSTGSVKAACEDMGMSYSKAWKKIKEAESALGCEVVTRVQGGKGGGQASLTPQGRWLLEAYSSFVDEATASVQEVFERHFGKGK